MYNVSTVTFRKYFNNPNHKQPTFLQTARNYIEATSTYFILGSNTVKYCWVHIIGAGTVGNRLAVVKWKSGLVAVNAWAVKQSLSVRT